MLIDEKDRVEQIILWLPSFSSCQAAKCLPTSIRAAFYLYLYHIISRITTIKRHPPASQAILYAIASLKPSGFIESIQKLCKNFFEGRGKSCYMDRNRGQTRSLLACPATHTTRKARPASDRCGCAKQHDQRKPHPLKCWTPPPAWLLNGSESVGRRRSAVQ